MNKKILIIAGMASLLAGCQRENLSAPAGDIIKVDVTGSSYTRCEGGCSSEGELLGTKMFVTEEGDTLCVSAYLSDLEEFLPQECAEETKGAPIYFNDSNKNLGSLYGNLNTTVYDASGIYSSKDKFKVGTAMENIRLTYDSGNWKFGGDSTYYWPVGDENLYFCTMAPVELKDSLVTNFNFEWNKGGNGKLTFDYTMPEPDSAEDGVQNDAVNQKDLLVGVNVNNIANGSKASIGLYHALTGVRFVMGETNATSVKLKSVSLNNFYSKGTATFDHTVTFGPDQPNVTWSNLSNPKTYTQTFSDEEVATWTTNAEFDHSANKEKTFMMIPQEIHENAQMSIYLANALHPEVLTFNMISKEEEKLKDWKNYAGKMITFRIYSYVGLVSVKVDDDVTTDAEDNAVKNNIRITNDGTSDIYVRAELVGNWVNEDGQVLAAWKEDNSYGTFKSSKGENANLAEVLDANWTKEADGFYYYKYYVRPGETLIHNMFDSFTILDKPLDTQGQWAGDVKMRIDALELSILVQAVRADEDKYNAKKAWGETNIDSLTNTADN